MLRLEAVRSGYTRIDVLREVSLDVPERSIVAVLGANGAGKTALLRAISGLNPVRGGRIRLGDAELAGAPPDAIVRQGVIQVPQGRMLFGPMSVRENLELGAYLLAERAELARRLARVHALFPILEERAAQPAAYLSGGEQQMLAIGRALMGDPKVLLLDEPSLGLAPRVFDQILERVQAIHAAGASILIAEQNARKVLRVAQHAYVLENGAVAFGGAASTLLTDPRIERAYLGATQH